MMFHVYDSNGVKTIILKVLYKARFIDFDINRLFVSFNKVASACR